MLGMVGVDIPWPPCRAWWRRWTRPLRGQGKVLLLSHEGRVAGVEGIPGRPWQTPGATAVGAGSRRLARQGDVATRWSPDGALLQTFVPVSMRGTDRKWGIYIELPCAVVLASALQLQGQLEEQAQHSVAAQPLIGGGSGDRPVLHLADGAAHRRAHPDRGGSSR